MFSGDGKQTTAFAAASEGGGVALQPNGKLVVTGNAGGDFALARYNSSGSLDTTFSGDGRQRTDMGGDEVAGDVALQPDGKIVVAGFGGPRVRDFTLARYDPNGTLDPTFSGDGKQTTNFGFASGARDLALQGNGKIVAVGFTGPAGSARDDFAVARYNPNGSLDTTFSGDGKQTTDLRFGEFDEAEGVVLQGAKVIAAGMGTANGIGLARYNPNGSLDTTFSGDGKLVTNVGANAKGRGVALQGDGKVVAVGDALVEGQGRNIVLTRYNPNGSLDSTFSGDGKLTTDLMGGTRELGNAVTLQGAKVVAVGMAGRQATGDDFALARYNPNGSLDTTFSGDGKQTTDFIGGADVADAVAVQGNGRIVAVGSSVGSDGISDFALARYLGG
jgi:uncharacterized delta-60 repeat protein